jgi:hypothetical protein
MPPCSGDTFCVEAEAVPPQRFNPNRNARPNRNAQLKSNARRSIAAADFSGQGQLRFGLILAAASLQVGNNHYLATTMT